MRLSSLTIDRLCMNMGGYYYGYIDIYYVAEFTRITNYPIDEQDSDRESP